MLGGYRQTMDERSIEAHTRVLIKALRRAGPRRFTPSVPTLQTSVPAC
jgi:hypothetical protein